MGWGKHLILDIDGCDLKAISDPDTISSFAKHLVKVLDMVPFGEPVVQRFGSGDKEGYTLVQLIETSNIVAHFVESTKQGYIDVFSCKDFNPEDVIKLTHFYFKFTSNMMAFLERDASPKR